MNASRLRPRMSLRTLLLVITGAAVWMGYVVHRAQSQAAALKALGAQVVIWDHEFPSGDVAKWDPSAKPTGPSWLENESNVGLFARVRGVIMVRPDAKAEIGHLAALGDLYILNLSGTDVDDEALQTVARLRQLRSLNLDWTPISDAGLVQLAKLSNLEALWLNETDVTDAGLMQLKGLTKLRRLNLEGADVTEEGVAALKAELPDCEIWWGRPSVPDPRSTPPFPRR